MLPDGWSSIPTKWSHCRRDEDDQVGEQHSWEKVSMGNRQPSNQHLVHSDDRINHIHFFEQVKSARQHADSKLQSCSGSFYECNETVFETQHSNMLHLRYDRGTLTRSYSSLVHIQLQGLQWHSTLRFFLPSIRWLRSEMLDSLLGFFSCLFLFDLNIFLFLFWFLQLLIHFRRTYQCLEISCLLTFLPSCDTYFCNAFV